MVLPQPDTDQISLAGVLAALGEETRLAIIAALDECGTQSMACRQFLDIAAKSNLTYHFGKLREAGVIQVEPHGTQRLVSLRRADLDRRFPGLLDSILREAHLRAALGKDTRMASEGMSSKR